MNGSIRQRGKTHTAYWFTIDPATGKRVQHSKGGFPKQKAARTHLNTILSKVEEGLWTPNSKMTVKEFVDSTWLPSLDAAAAGGSLKPTTVAFYRHIVMRYVLTPLGGVKLASLAATMLNSFYGDLLKNGRASGRSGLSPTTVARVHVTVHRMLRDAVRWGLLQRNVADQATAPRPRKQQLAPWSPRETGQFLQASSGTRLGPLWHLAAMTGLRRGEVCRLRWADLELDQRRLTVVRARVMAGGQVVTSSPKTATSARTIGLDVATVSVLRAHRSRQNEWRLAAGEAWLGERDGLH